MPRIFHPWLIATLGGAFLGTLLLSLDSSESAPAYVEYVSRAAAAEQPTPEVLTSDPFAPSASLAAPPDAGEPVEIVAPAAETANTLP